MEKLDKVARYGVYGYGRQDIYRDDEGGEFVYHDDFKAMQQRAEAAEAELEVEKDIHDDTLQAMHLWCERAKEAEAKLVEVINLVIYTGEMSRPKHEAIEAYLCETLRNIKAEK